LFCAIAYKANQTSSLTIATKSFTNPAHKNALEHVVRNSREEDFQTQETVIASGCEAIQPIVYPYYLFQNQFPKFFLTCNYLTLTLAKFLKNLYNNKVLHCPHIAA